MIVKWSNSFEICNRHITYRLCSWIPSWPPAVFKPWPILPLSWNSAIFTWDLEFRWSLIMLTDSFETWIIWGRVSGKGAWRLRLASLLKLLLTEYAVKPGARMWIREVLKEILTALLAHLSCMFEPILTCCYSLSFTMGMSHSCFTCLLS